MTANSQDLGRGSEFAATLPLASHNASPDPSATDEQSRTGPTGIRLLVVDDNKDAAITLAMLLQLRSHDVRTAHSGASALETAAQFRPEIVFLDIGMPAMDGYEVARRMRRIKGLEKIILVALTGWGQLADRQRATDAGFDFHLTKPADPLAIESMLADYKRED